MIWQYMRALTTARARDFWICSSWFIYDVGRL